MICVSFCINGISKKTKSPNLSSALETNLSPTSLTEADVTALVEKFGQQLKMVSLLAPPETVKSDMEKYYGCLISPDLLAKWQNDPQNAPGRMVSSPWPDRIEIRSIEKINDQSYKVSGDIVEITSEELSDDNAAARRTVTLTVSLINNCPVITEFSLSGYTENSDIVYKNQSYGFTFSLPISWKGFTIVTSGWTGTNDNGQAVESGPIVSIRHPLWTNETPRQDIPIMVFTKDQWDKITADKVHIGAAPVNPSELGSNSKYVFALPARYNFAFPEGFEEVETIINSAPLKATEDFKQ